MILTSDGIPTEDSIPLREIIRMLRGGKQPYSIPTSEYYEYQGDQRETYFIGDYVVKTHCVPANIGLNLRTLATKPMIPVRPLRKLGISRPRQWYVREWVIQPKYDCSKTYNVTGPVYWWTQSRDPWNIDEPKLDLHSGNIGFNRREIGRASCR